MTGYADILAKTRLFTPAAYAEDQADARTILTTHVLHRGAQAGVPVGVGLLAVRALRGKRPLTADNVLRASGRGALGGIAFLAVALAGRMYDKAQIEWQDRAYRLLHNKGQLLTDDWSIAGSVVGLAGTATRVVSSGQVGVSGGQKALVLLGGTMLGNWAGILAHMAVDGPNAQ